MTSGHRSRRHRIRTLAMSMSAMAMAAGGLTVGAPPAHANFADTAYACAYYSNVSLFGGPYGSMGCGTQTSTYATANSAAPSVRDDWSNVPLSAVDSDGAAAIYGPAYIFSSPYDALDRLSNSGALEVYTWGSSGNGSSVNARAKASGVGPSPFWTATPNSAPPSPDGSVGYVESTCSSSNILGKTGTATIKNGRVDTATDMQGYPTNTVVVPENPPPNYRVDFTINNVGDSGYMLFNEQIFNLDGSLTINGSHMYMLGPTAKGDVVIGQVTCGRVL